MSHTPTERSCEHYRALALAGADGELTAAEVQDLDRHTALCQECRSFASDIREIRDVAAHLPKVTPRANGWAAIAARLKQEPAEARRRPIPGRTVMLALAAVLTMAVGSTLFVLRTRGPAGGGAVPAAGTSAGAAVNAPGDDPVKSVREELRLAEAHYDKAIAGLEQIAKAGQSSLDPKIAETLQKNIGIIDKAIGDSRTALQSQPTSQLAQESLFEALRRKVALLEDTIALINEMRKGNPAGAARVIRGLNKT
jgi:hypothetical protein